MRIRWAGRVRVPFRRSRSGEGWSGNWIGENGAKKTLANCRFVILSLAGVCLAGCLGGSSTKSTVTVVVSPSSAQVYVGLTAKFSATVTGASDTTVTWKVNGTEGGNTKYGTITTTGVYTAPGSVPSGTVTISAVSQSDSNASGNATVTVLATAVVTVSPAAASVPTGTSQQFSATVNGSASDAVEWSVDAISGGNSTVGTIDSNGLYTAPLTPPPLGTVSITATSTADSSQSATATVAVPFGAGALKGQYSFLVRGTTSSGTLGRTGSILADGEGNITAGIEDVNSGSSTATVVFNSGTYSITADDRGKLTLTNNTTGSLTFYIAMVSNSLANLVESDTSVTSASGALRKQDPSKFSSSSMAGSYVFNFAGVDIKGYPQSLIGRFTSDGADRLSQGVLDINDNATASGATSFTGSSYQIDSTYGATYGRGVASIDGLNFAFYIVDNTRWDFLETDNAEVTAGEVVAQVSPPAATSGLSGGFCFVGMGGTKASSSSSGKPVVRGGRLTMDGSGNLSGVVLVSNSDGSAVQVPASGTDSGTYTIDSSGTGRGTATFTDSSAGTFQFVFYLVSGSQAVFQDLSKNLILGGELDAQTTSSITRSALAGSHAFLWNGNNNGRMDYSGQYSLTSASSSNVSGTVDFNQAGSPGSNDTFSGTLTVSGDGTGRNKLSLTATNPSGSFSFAAFVVDADTILLVSTDQNDVLAGKSSRQF